MLLIDNKISATGCVSHDMQGSAAVIEGMGKLCNRGAVCLAGRKVFIKFVNGPAEPGPDLE